MGAPPKMVNSIASKIPRSYDDEERKILNEEIRFLSNDLGVTAPPIKGKAGIKV